MSTQHLFQQHTVRAAAVGLVLALVGSGAHATGNSTFATFSSVVGHTTPAAMLPPALVGSDIVVNLAGVKSYDGLGAGINTVLVLAAQPGAVVDQVSWSLNLSTVGESWLSEAAVLLTNSNGDGIYFNPGGGDDVSGTQAYSGSGSLVSLGIGFNILGDGKLFVEFYEDFDDLPGAVDANYLSGNLTLGGIAAAIPEPGSYGLMALGLFGVALAARRRCAG